MMNNTLKAIPLALIVGLLLASMNCLSNGLPKRSACQKLLEDPSYSYQPVIKVEPDLSNVPPELHAFVQERLKVSRSLASRNSNGLKEFLQYVLSTPWKEKYGLRPKADIEAENPELYKELKTREMNLRNTLLEEINGDSYLLSITPMVGYLALFVEKYRINDEEVKKWRDSSSGDKFGRPLMTLSFNQEAFTTGEKEQFRSFLSQIHLDIRVPVFHDNRYVCDLYLSYCLPGISGDTKLESGCLSILHLGCFLSPPPEAVFHRPRVEDTAKRREGQGRPWPGAKIPAILGVFYTLREIADPTA